MKQIAPDYYRAFACIGGGCPRNCCIGWEIDIDEASLLRYGAVEGALGQKLRRSIAVDDCAHFLLGPEERCPFLNHDDLCQLILELGKDSLCQICRDHPRFYNRWPGRTEAGLGLCCPAAAELILHRQEPMALTILADDGEEQADDPAAAALLALRQRLLGRLQDRRYPVSQRLDAILSAVGAADPFPLRQWAEIYRPLERMDGVWDMQLDRLAAGDTVQHTPAETDFETAREQLAVYFLYRHLFGAWEDGYIAQRVAFCAHAAELLSALAHDVAELTDLAQLYSAEIEYSDKNLIRILEALSQQGGADSHDARHR